MNINELKIFLANNQTATTINLSSQGIDNEGIKLIAEFIRTNETVTTLYLNNNKIENVDALAQGLRLFRISWGCYANTLYPMRSRNNL
jgi:hypothetical protein